MARKYIQKLIRFNLSAPMDKRISFEAIEHRREQLARIVRSIKLMVEIHSATDKIVEMQRQIWDNLDGRMIGREFAGYVDQNPYNIKPHSIGYLEPSLSAENSLGHRLTSQDVVSPYPRE